MDWELYDNFQAQLGGVGDSFASRVAVTIGSSDANTEVKTLCEELCKEIRLSLNELADHISHSLIAMGK